MLSRVEHEKSFYNHGAWLAFYGLNNTIPLRMTGEFSAWHPILFHLIQIVDISEIDIKEIRKGSGILILYYDNGQNCLLAI